MHDCEACHLARSFGARLVTLLDPKLTNVTVSNRAVNQGIYL
jgi:hypothetical protein